jgi:hypothetical protein
MVSTINISRKIIGVTDNNKEAIMRTAIAFALGSVAFTQIAWSAEAPSSLSLTIYNQNLALIEEVRSLDLGVGRSKLEFKDVSAGIRPETVALTADRVSIVEQNFDYDLLTPAKLMEKAVGKEVQIVRTNPGTGAEVTEKATVLSVNDGVVLRIGDRIEVLRADNIPTRVIFDKVPENLRARPTLSVSVESERAGRRDARLSYLSTGLSWKADYVTLFDEKAGKLDLQGWITLTNQSGTSFANAQTQLIAGEINLVRNDPNYEWQQQQRRQAMRRSGTGGGGGERPKLADYYVYPLSERTTIAENQTKQVGFLDINGISAKKVYRHQADWFQSLEDPVHADVAVDFSNAGSAGLGAQLPAGIVRVYVRDAEGKPKFVGEDSIEHTPQGSELSIKTGEAFDITVQPTLVSQQRASLFRSRYEMKYLVRNAKSEAATINVRQSGLWRDGKVLSESLPSTRVDAYSLQWSVPVPANGETTLTFTVETGW